MAIDPTIATRAVEHSALYVRFSAALDLMETKLVKLVANAPLLLVAILIVLFAAWFGSFLSRRMRVVTRLGRNNPYMDGLLRGIVRGLVTLAGVLVALNLLNATALVSAVLGSAGTVVLRPAADFVGEMVATFRVRDVTGDPDRDVEGQVVLVVSGPPATPAPPRVDEVRDRAVVQDVEPQRPVAGAGAHGHRVDGTRAAQARDRRPAQPGGGQREVAEVHPGHGFREGDGVGRARGVRRAPHRVRAGLLHRLAGRVERDPRAPHTAHERHQRHQRHHRGRRHGAAHLG